VITLAGYHLRCRVAGTATGRLEHLALLVHVGQAEVDNLYVVLIVQQQVLRFQIAVADPNFVDVLHAGDYLLSEATGLFLGETFAFDDVVEKFTAACVLHDEEQLARGFNDLK